MNQDDITLINSLDEKRLQSVNFKNGRIESIYFEEEESTESKTSSNNNIKWDDIDLIVRKGRLLVDNIEKGSRGDEVFESCGRTLSDAIRVISDLSEVIESNE